MKNEDMSIIFDDLIKYLKLSINSNDIMMNEQLKKWNCQITIEELNDSLSKILNVVLKWYNDYQNNNVLIISLKEYDFVSKESSYILGECALIDDIYADAINHLVLCIGKELCENLKNDN